MGGNELDSSGNSKSNVVLLDDFRKPEEDEWHRHGYLKNQLSTWRETKKWRALAAEHEEARRKVNDLVAAGSGPGTTLYRNALQEYVDACRLVLCYRYAKPRHLPSMIRCAAEIFGLSDPAWIHAVAYPKDADWILSRLYCRANEAELALNN